MSKATTDRPAGVLVVGGTGMLAPAVAALAAQGSPTFVVARRPQRLGMVTGVVPVVGDWRDPAALTGAVRQALTSHGCSVVDRAVTWIHGPYRDRMHEALAGILAPDAVVVSLHGSAGADPSRTAPAAPPVHAPPRRYRTVVLGFADQPAGGTRWLTHQEISQAALAALDDPQPIQVAGRVSPWQDRP